MMRVILFAASVVALYFVLAGDAFAQSKNELLVREIAPCYEQVSPFIQPEPKQDVVPCRDPGINEIVIRKLAGNVHGVSASYHDYGQIWVRVFECDLVGTGPESNGVITVTPLPEAGKELSACRALVKRTPKPGTMDIAVNVEWGAECESLCSHPSRGFTITGRPDLAFAPAFDCFKASSPAEKAICVSWELSAKDLQLAKLWAELPGREKREEIQAQQRWLRERDQCQYDGVCLSKSYELRLAALCSQSGRKIDSHGNCSP